MRARLEAPFGHIEVEEDDGIVTAVHLGETPGTDDVPDGFPTELVQGFRRYFEGETPLPDVPFAATEIGTEFQHDVWQALREVPPGQPVTYGELAYRIGRPGAARAVGQALRENPLPLVWPCHRVVASNGLGGFGGASNNEDPREKRKLDMKAWLLEHEGFLYEQ